MLRTRAVQVSLWEAVLPAELLQLPLQLARVDALLDDPVFFTPFVPFFDPRVGRPSTPMETYLRMMFLKSSDVASRPGEGQLPQGVGSNPGVDGFGSETAMAQHAGDLGKTRSRGHQLAGEGVAKPMGSHLCDPARRQPRRTTDDTPPRPNGPIGATVRKNSSRCRLRGRPRWR